MDSESADNEVLSAAEAQDRFGIGACGCREPAFAECSECGQEIAVLPVERSTEGDEG